MTDHGKLFHPLTSTRYHAFALAHADERLFKVLMAGLIALWVAGFAFLACTGQLHAVDVVGAPAKTLVTCEVAPAADCVVRPGARITSPSI